MAAMTPQTLAVLKKYAQQVEMQKVRDIGDFVSIAVNKTQSADQIEQTIAHIGSFGYANKISDGDNVPLDEKQRLHRKTMNGTNNVRAKGFSMTFLGKKIDPFGLFKDAAPQMMAAHVQTKNALAAAFHAAGFSTGQTYAPDGVTEAFYSATHAGGPAGGTTYSNLISAQAPSFAAFTDAQTNIKRQRTNRNMVIPAPSRYTVIVPDELEVVTAQIIESMGEYGTADRNDNKVIKSRFDYFVNPFATSATQWFVKGHGEGLDEGVVWVNFCPTTVVQTGVQQNAQDAILTLCAYDIGWYSGRGWAGCAGA